MIESEIQKQIIDYLKSAGFLVFRMNAGKVQNNIRLSPPGTPDLLVISPYGKYTWIEVKTATGQLRDSQKEMIHKLSLYGCRVCVCRSVEDAEKIACGTGKV